jgi:hypothetical protein
MLEQLSAVLVGAALLLAVGLADADSMKPLDPAASNPDVFFYDGFETGDVSKWDDRNHDSRNPNLRVVSEPGNAFGGSHALEITGPVGLETGGSVATWFMPGYDQVYARWYCKFSEDFDQGNFMHFNRLMGGPPGDYYAVFGHAGTRPNGRDRFSTGFEPWSDYGKNPPPGAWAFYSYFPDMKPDRQGNYYGNMFFADPPLILERNRWYCIEMMVKCNTPGKADGEQAAWVDGKEVVHVNGIRWRDIEELKVHCFRISLYLHDSPRVNRVWFDNVAVSTKYIGPAR